MRWTGFAALALTAAAACGISQAQPVATRTMSVIAAENFWGSIASQLGGDRAHVQSVLSDPNADPHEYESSTTDARAFASADLVIVNGAGYDAWADRLLQANPNRHRIVMDVASLLGGKEGDNPHFWYDPASVARVADGVSDSLRSLDPANAPYLTQLRSRFATALAPYERRVAEIRQRFAGTKLGATESIFTYMAQALGLDLISPREFMNAVAEGTDPPASSVAEFEDQVTSRQIRVLVYNVQTATAVTTNIRRQAATEGIPVVGVSETLQPTSASFQDWQLGQLLSLENALDSAAPAR
jgi:zinc/manganese transport system substrate-binding protein